CPPTDSDRCTPVSPCSAAAFQYGGGLGMGVSSASWSTSDGAIRATRDRTESARSLCSGVIAMGICHYLPGGHSAELTGGLGRDYPDRPAMAAGGAPSIHPGRRPVIPFTTSASCSPSRSRRQLSTAWVR